MISRRLAARDERGSVLVIFAVSVGSFILLAGLALDIGNWFVHKRKLQSRVDAAAYAAAVEYGYLFPGCVSSATLADRVRDVAKRFGGDSSAAVPLNTAVNDTTTIRVNAASPDDPSDYTDEGTAAHPCFDHATGDFGTPTGGYWTDIKAVDRGAVSLFGGFGIPTPTISATARVALQKPASMTGLRPVAVADPRSATCVQARIGDQVVGLDKDPGNPLHWTMATPLDISPNGAGTPIGITLGCGACAGSESVTYPDIGFIATYSESASAEVDVRRVELTAGGGCNRVLRCSQVGSLRHRCQRYGSF